MHTSDLLPLSTYCLSEACEFFSFARTPFYHKFVPCFGDSPEVMQFNWAVSGVGSSFKTCLFKPWAKDSFGFYGDAPAVPIFPF